MMVSISMGLDLALGTGVLYVWGSGLVFAGLCDHIICVDSFILHCFASIHRVTSEREFRGST